MPLSNTVYSERYNVWRIYDAHDILLKVINSLYIACGLTYFSSYQIIYII